MSIIVREINENPYRMAEYMETAKKYPKCALKEMFGAALLILILLGFCFVVGL